jgi:hypothetical protein
MGIDAVARKVDIIKRKDKEARRERRESTVRVVNHKECYAHTTALRHHSQVDDPG